MLFFSHSSVSAAVVVVEFKSHSQSQRQVDWLADRQPLRVRLVTSKYSRPRWSLGLDLASYPVALGGVYGLLAGGGAGAHAIYVLTVAGVAVMRGSPVTSSAQRVASTATIVTGVGEGTWPAGRRGRQSGDYGPESVAFMSWAGGDERFLSSSSSGSLR